MNHKVKYQQLKNLINVFKTGEEVKVVGLI